MVTTHSHCLYFINSLYSVQCTVYSVHVVCIIYAKMAIYDCIPYTTIYYHINIMYVDIHFCGYVVFTSQCSIVINEKKSRPKSMIHSALWETAQSLLISSPKLCDYYLFIILCIFSRLQLQIKNASKFIMEWPLIAYCSFHSLSVR